MDEIKTSTPQHNPPGAGKSTIDKNDRIGSRFRLEPGNPRNPDYTRSPFIQVSDSAIVGAIKDAQKKQRSSEKNLFKPSFVYENKPTALVERFLPKTFPTTPVYVMAANGIPTRYFTRKQDGKTESDVGSGTNHSIETVASITPKVNGQGDDEDKSSKVCKEVPGHIKAMESLIKLMNERHSYPEEFASASLHDIPGPIFGQNYKDLEYLHHSWSDPVFPYPGDRIYPPVDRSTVVCLERPDFAPDQMVQNTKNLRHPMSKSGTADLFSYRPVDGQFDFMGSGDACNRKIDENGALVVEDIVDEEEEELTFPKVESIGECKKKTTPGDLMVGRAFGNISPISEEMMETETQAVTLGTTCPENSSPGAAAELISRLNCSSPILAHSPSLRKTPVFANVLQDTPPSTGRRVRNIARALHDISDRDEEEQQNPSSSSSADEETESFEIDLDAAGDAVADVILNSSLKEKSLEDIGSEYFDVKQVDGKPKVEVSLEELCAKRTVWETLSANIEAHIGDGNPAGFVSGPTDHPLQIPDAPELEYPSYMYYNEPLAVIPKLPY